MVRVGVWLQKALHHGQEVPVDGQNLLRVGEQHLETDGDTQGCKDTRLFITTLSDHHCIAQYDYIRRPDYSCYVLIADDADFSEGAKPQAHFCPLPICPVVTTRSNTQFVLAWNNVSD